MFQSLVLLSSTQVVVYRMTPAEPINIVFETNKLMVGTIVEDHPILHSINLKWTIKSSKT